MKTKIAYFVALSLLAVVVTISGDTRFGCSREINSLLSRLQQDATTNDAMQELLSRNGDTAVKNCLASRLPALLKGYREIHNNGIPNIVWGNEARVAGEFKVTEAAPVLAKRIDMQTSWAIGGSLGYNFINYAAVRALVLIGPSAVPIVTNVLKDGTPLQREEAAYVLGYIRTEAAWKALEEHLPREKDPKVRQRIQELLKRRG